jgi:hypothetical protein
MPKAKSTSSRNAFEPPGEETMSRIERVVLAMGVVAALVFAGRTARAADPTTADCLAASESSLTLRNQHHLRDARAQLLICSAASCPGDIRAECIRRVGEVNAAIPTIVFAAKDGAGNDIGAVKVSMNGVPLAERLEGTALSIDPGEHTFTFETTGQTTVQKHFVIREGEKDRRERITFGAMPTVAGVPVAASAPASPSGGTPSISATASETGGSQAHSDRWGKQKIVGASLGAASVVGLATGIIFGLTYDSRASDFNDNGCYTSLPDNGPAGCQSRRDGVRTAEYLIIAGYTSAVVLGSVGAYLFFTAPAESVPSVALRSGSFKLRCLPSGDAGIMCGGRF